jgi:hypothetical protein
MLKNSDSIFLKPFGSTTIGVGGSLQIEDNLIEASFFIADPQNRVKKPPAAEKLVIKRKDGLWQTTCFEIFIADPSTESYFEINLSPWGLWNAYVFDRYRLPQPPKVTEDIKIMRLQWQEDTLSATLQLNSKNKKWHCALTTVVETNNGEKSYFASQHSGQAPDFHLRKNFSLHRG